LPAFFKDDGEKNHLSFILTALKLDLSAETNKKGYRFTDSSQLYLYNGIEHTKPWR